MKGTRRNRKMIEEIVQKIVSGYAPQKIILFGSYAYGKPSAESDIDLLIIKDTDKAPIDRWMDVKRLLRDPRRMVSVSPLVYTSDELHNRLAMNDLFLQDVVQMGEVLYG